LQRRKFPPGKDLDADGVPDLTWFAPDGREPGWQDESARTLRCQLDGNNDGARPDVDRLFFNRNSHLESQWVKPPPLGSSRLWRRAIDTSLPGGADSAEPGEEAFIDPPGFYIANPRTVDRTASPGRIIKTPIGA
jgi:hypothetical protein